MVAVDPDYLARRFKALDVGADSVVGLFGRDGYVRIREPAMAGMYERDLTLRPDGRGLFARLADAPAGVYEIASGLDGRPRIFGYRTTENLPLVVTVGKSVDVVLAPLVTERRNALAVGVAASAVILLGCLFLLSELERRRRRERLLVETHRALGQAETLFRGVFENATDHLFVHAVAADGSFALETLNPSAAALIGRLPEEVRGKVPEDVMPPGTAAIVRADIEGVIRSGEPLRRAEERVHGDGTHRFEVILVPLREAGGTRRTGIITLDDLPATDLLLLSGQSKLPFTTDLKLSARADIALDGGRIEAMKATLRTSDGTFLVEEKDFNPVTIESLNAAFSWDEAARVMTLDGLDYLGAGNAVNLTGTWAEAKAGEDFAWTATLSSRNATLRGAAAKDKPVTISAMDGHLTGRAGGIAIDSFAMTGAGIHGNMSGTLGTTADDDGLTLHVTASDSEARTALRLWPENIAPGARNYLVDELRAGRIDAVDITVDMSGAELAAATRGDPMPDNAVHIDFRVSDATLEVSADAPPLTRGTVAGTITGRTTRIRNVTADIRMADGRALNISEGAFVIPEIAPDKVVADIGLRLSGGADALAALLQTKMFKALSGVELDPATVKGQADLRIGFPLDLKHIPDLPDLPVAVTGTLSDLTVDKVVGKDKLESGRFAVSYDPRGFTLKGDAKLSGAPVSIDMHQAKTGGAGEVLVNLTADDALRARKGLPTAPQLSGPIAVKATIPLVKAGATRPPIRVEADLARAGIDGLVPGLTKAAGKAGRLTFALVDTGPGMDLRDIVLDAGVASARGSASLGSEGGLERADLTNLKLSPGDDMRVSLERSGNGYRVAVKGAVADARPFLKMMTAPEGKGQRDASPKDIEAEIQLGILTGFNDEALTNANVRLTLRGKDVRSAAMSAKFRSAPFVASVTKGERGAPTLAIESGDAGATLRFVDVYRRMYGGRLNLGIVLSDGPQAGVVQIREFSLRNEPALSSIMAQGPETVETVDARGRKRTVAGQGSAVAFDRMRANFVRTGSRVDFSDAAISNAAMGFTLSGFLDTARERTDINGTFVPLYGLNNIVSQVPVIGPLLGGGHNEGLFAVNFRVSGKLNAPDVSVNPLSAVAPGFLRKLFSAGGGSNFADGVPPAVQGGDR
ncbi:PAS domain-containing protein [Methylobacterium sp. WL122]|nr:PAS domain-containing protein [Methylobacterium sp. WL122]